MCSTNMSKNIPLPCFSPPTSTSNKPLNERDPQKCSINRCDTRSWFIVEPRNFIATMQRLDTFMHFRPFFSCKSSTDSEQRLMLIQSSFWTRSVPLSNSCHKVEASQFCISSSTLFYITNKPVLSSYLFSVASTLPSLFYDRLSGPMYRADEIIQA